MSLTIKQAFEALSASCSAGMKNPFFVMRRLKESFADVASKVVAGSVVTVTPITNTGTKIATIGVDGSNKDIYAPKVSVTQTVTTGTEIAEVDGTKIYAPGSGTAYSTSKTQVGTWTDGRPVYEKTYTGIGRVNNGSYSHFDSSVGAAVAIGWVQSLSISGVNATKPASCIHGVVPEIQFTQSVGMALENNTGYDINVFAVTIRWVENAT